MSTRIETILLRARDTLADPTGERWSDPRLLRLVEEGQQDIAKHTKILKAQVDILLAEGQAVYSLPSDLWLITRAAFNGCIIPLYSHPQMDELVRNHHINNNDNYSERIGYGSSYFDGPEPCWETTIASSVEALIYDRRNIDEIRVYPIPDDTISQSLYTFNADDPEFNGLLGVATDVTDFTFTTVFGTVTDFDDSLIATDFESDFGVMTGANESDDVIHIWYIRIPVGEITSVSSELAIPSMFDTALKHYVVSMAFDDDYDTRFAEKAQKAAALYERELGVVKETESHGATRDSQTNTTAYRGAFS
tara:strand:+ start:5548 stop:6468 length:921 start_codon:yes stop_codon:yes gene_type:complete